MSHTSNSIQLKIRHPRSKDVEIYLGKWDKEEDYPPKEKALKKLCCELCPTNTNIEDILLKSSVINTFYGTNIFDIYPVAKHILGVANIDKRLEAGDITLVSEIANGPTKRRNYSFATKYCSWHQPSEFPIYDSFVGKLLLQYQRLDHFANFNKLDDLRDYSIFCDVIRKFRIYYELKYSLKELDKFLWQLGKETFPQ